MADGPEPATLLTFDTEYCADSVEFCPAAPHTDLVAIGTYQLVKRNPNGQSHAAGSESSNAALPEEAATESGQESQFARENDRIGRLLLKSVEQRPGAPTASGDTVYSLRDRVQRESAAILDLKWSHQLVGGSTLLGQADSSGRLAVHRIQTGDDGQSPTLEAVTCSLLETADLPGASQPRASPPLALSLDWSNRLQGSGSPNLIKSSSDGTLTQYALCSDRLQPLATWQAHSLEAWVAAYDPWHPHVVYSGADDGLFHVWDMRTAVSDSQAPTPSQRSKVHEAGVTTVAGHHLCEHVFVTGSYDEKVRLWDRRGGAGPRSLIDELNVGGGVWRLKWHPTQPDKLLVAAMYDWSDANDTGARSLVGTCSFYDHTFHLWSAESV